MTNWLRGMERALVLLVVVLVLAMTGWIIALFNDEWLALLAFSVLALLSIAVVDIGYAIVCAEHERLIDEQTS